MWVLGWGPNHKEYLACGCGGQARGSQSCLHQGLFIPGAHILVPVGTGFEMGLPGQLLLEGALEQRETLLHPHPVCQDAHCDGGGDRRGFLPVVPSISSWL